MTTISTQTTNLQNTPQGITSEGTSSGSTETGSGINGVKGDLPSVGTEVETTSFVDGETTYQQQQQFNDDVERFFLNIEASIIADDIDPDMSVADMIEKLLSGIRSDSILGELLIKFASMAREQALDVRLAERDQVATLMKSAAGEVREAAEKMLNSAIVQATVGIVASCVSILCSAVSLNELRGMGKIGKEVGELSKLQKAYKGAAEAFEAAGDTKMAKKVGDFADKLEDQIKALTKKMDKLHQRSESLHEIGQTIDTLGQTTGNMVEGLNQASIKIDEAERLELEAEKEVSASNVDLAKNIQQELLEMIKSVLEFIRTMNTAGTDMQQNFTRLAG